MNLNLGSTGENKIDMNELLKAVGLSAGIGGIALVVFLFLFQKIDLTKATRRQLILFMWLVWSVCVIGMFIYFANLFMDKRDQQAPLNNIPSAQKTIESKEIPNFNIELHCGSQPPGENSELAKFFEYAEENKGKTVNVSLTYYPKDCECPSRQTGTIDLLEIDCEHNPEWHLSEKMKQYNCVQALGLAGYSAGVGSFCFPSHDLLPTKEGYSREKTATYENISGEFLAAWEWSLGAPHVQLLLPE